LSACGSRCEDVQGVWRRCGCTGRAHASGGRRSRAARRVCTATSRADRRVGGAEAAADDSWHLLSVKAIAV